MSSNNMEPDELDFLLPANCPDPYFDTWDRHNSIAFSTATKGLRNAPGENNCFVNSAVQVFWHLDVFRRSYRRLSGHTCMGNSCIFCALKVIFTQFQFSDQSSLHPDALRKALAETFANQQRFQLGHMDDAAECFENILRRIHFHIANNCNEDTCTAPHCLPHQKFSLNILEKVVCPCGSSSNPLNFSEMVHYVSAKALVSQARVMQETGDVLHPDRFGLLLRNANAMGDIRDCPGACGKTVQIRRTLLNSPDVVSIGLVWDSDHPTVETTTEVARNIGTTILMQDVFHSVMQDMRSLPKLQLVGLVCYYGKHYSTFVFHSKLQVWIYFDDATVREIGPRWEHVVDKCSKGRYQPLLLLYANPAATPVSVETAPRKRTMAPGFGIPGGPEEESSLDRTHESISSQNSFQQRSRTPNPEPAHLPQDMNPAHPRARSVTPSAMTEHDVSDHRRQQSFIMAMGGKGQEGIKTKPPGRMIGGQAGLSCAQGMAFSGSSESQIQGQNYSDYTLSTSDQYRRPSMGGFEPAPLPLTPNMKGYQESQRRDSFIKKGKESIRADVVRYQMNQSNMALPGNNQGDGGQLGYLSDLSSKSPSTSMFYQGHSTNNQGHIRQRTMSHGGDETCVPDSSGHENHSHGGHTIVKPMANSQGGYDNRRIHHADNGLSHLSHTPVQSGLATLPRKKKEMSAQHQLHQRQGSGLAPDTQEATTSFSKHNSNTNLASDHHPRSSSTASSSSISNPVGLPPAIPAKHVQHQSQSSISEQDNKKLNSKKLKKELKRAEKKQLKSSYSKHDSSPSPSPSPSTSEAPQLSLVSSSSLNAALGATPPVHRRPEEYKDEKLVYIDRRMVESILKHQGLQRQPSTNSNGSSSSGISGISNSTVESDSIMGRLLAAKLGEAATGNQTGDGSFDNVSIGSHKDSGYGGSDRNSSSSTGSGTIDPYTQYFISKSMVVPRNLNPQFLQQQQNQPGPQQPHQMVSDFTSPSAQVYTASLAQGDAPIKDLSGMSREEMSKHLYETLTQRKIMHPIKESSQEDILKLVSHDKTPTSTPQRGPSPSSLPPPLPPGPPPQDCEPEEREGKEGRPPPIPPKNFAAFQVSKSSHHREPSIDSLDTSEVHNDYFVSMCEKADDLMDRCILAETQEDLPAALRFCDGALGCLKEAMNQTDIANKALVYAQKKHNSCLLKSRSLFKRSAAQNSSDVASQGSKRSSITSTDSDNSDKPLRRMASKEQLLNANGRSRSVTSQLMSPPNNTPASQAIKAGRSHQSPAPQHYPAPSQSQQVLHTALVSNQKQQPPPPPARPNISRPVGSFETTHARSGSSSSTRSFVAVSSSLPQNPMALSSTSSTVSVSSPSHTINVASNMPLDAYGTLPRNRKHRRTSDPTGNSEVYQMYLHKQKNNHQQTGSTGSDASRESDSSSCESSGGDNPQRKSSKAEIKELLQANTVQKQMQQFTASTANGHQQDQTDNKNYLSSSLTSMLMLNDNLGGTVDAGPKYWRGQPIQQVESGSRLSHSSQGSTISASSQQDFGQISQHPGQPEQCKQQLPQYNQTYSNTQQHFKPTSGTGSAFSSPPRSQGNSQPLQQQNQYQQQQQSQRLPPRPHSSQDTMNTTYVNSYSNQQPAVQAVSGYNQPLPGNRPYSHNQMPRGASSTGPQTYAQVYPPQTLRQGFQPNTSQENNKILTTGYPVVKTNHSSNKSNHVNNHTQQQPNIQSLGQGVNNLNIVNRRPQNGGPPPLPPTRTTSNPDFQQNLRTSSLTPAPSASSSNFTQAQPNSHLNMPHPGNGRVSSPCLPVASPFPPSRHTPQLKHATSTNGLNCFPQTLPRPLERCSSQPDVQHLGLSSYADILHPSHTSSLAYSSIAKDVSDFSVNGSNMTLPQTSNNNPDIASEPESKPSVRALASQFDAAHEKPAVKPKPASGTVSLRSRSKSESNSKKPKSVLKSKKNKGKAPRKSVTFAADLSNCAAGYESAAELSTFSSKSDTMDRAYFSDDEEHVTDFTSPQARVNNSATAPFSSVAHSDNELDDVEDSSNSDDGPAPREEVACQLCRKREMALGSTYCEKCSFYMSKLVSS
ncbi:inactive ubiquitin carboxyl-terminal hydrolase 54 [Plakobranchus ocellatus]|uniref:Inactive ubiquitin carboxyl-terminal hydrolase 54 n=1 Tax=Plakobranchus ocellatus TaxID=259542 RepID=A0AAV3YID8_9GAST|nr:inactive ubiquitin carboxyl-terminal hydrolase 54 [Plakobranchus ocellatus]